MAVSPFFFDIPVLDRLFVTTASVLGTAAALSTGLGNGSKYVSVIAASDSTVAHSVIFGTLFGGNFAPLGSRSVPAGAGVTTGIPAVPLFDPSVTLGIPFDNDGNPFMFLPSTSYNLAIKPSSA